MGTVHAALSDGAHAQSEVLAGQPKTSLNEVKQAILAPTGFGPAAVALSATSVEFVVTLVNSKLVTGPPAPARERSKPDHRGDRRCHCRDAEIQGHTGDPYCEPQVGRQSAGSLTASISQRPPRGLPAPHNLIIRCSACPDPLRAAGRASLKTPEGGCALSSWARRRSSFVCGRREALLS